MSDRLTFGEYRKGPRVFPLERYTCDCGYVIVAVGLAAIAQARIDHADWIQYRNAHETRV